MFSTKRKRNKLGQFTKTSPWTKRFSRFAPIMFVILGMLIFNVFPTNAYFNDTENSTANTYTAGTLNFHLNPSTDLTPLPLGKGETTSTSITLVNDGSLGFQYTASTTDVGGASDLCNYLNLQANLNGTPIYNGSLSGFLAIARNYVDPSVWNFVVTLPNGADNNLQDKICNFKITFNGWQEGLLSTQGFNNIEQINATISSGHWYDPPTAPNVVLNEILPNPDPSASYPANKEFIELYNNGSIPVDVLGWKITEMTSGGATTTHQIVSSGAAASQMQPSNGGTIIPAGGFLVLVFGGSSSYLNNSGDTVGLYDGSNTLLDLHTYDNHNLCSLTPTPGSTDGTITPSGSTCSGDIPANKSFARIPDGTGPWFDPYPTPGGPNKMEEEATGTSTPQISGGGSTDTSSIATSTDFIASTTESVIDDSSATTTATTTPETVPDVSTSTESAIIPSEPEGPVISEPEPVVVPEPVIEPDSTSSPQAAPVIESPAPELPPSIE